jgi:spermidine synthase
MPPPVDQPLRGLGDDLEDEAHSMTEIAERVEADESETTSGRTYHAEILLMSFAALLLEVSYTRIVSFKLYYYYTFLVIGLALLGIGCGAVFVATSARLRRASTDAVILWGFVLGAVSVLAGFLVVARTPINTLTIWEYGTAASFKNVALLVVICVALFASFISIGVMIATLFARRTKDINRLYFYDLLGAGIACALVVFLLFWIGPPATIFLAGLVMAAGGLRLARQGRSWAVWPGGVLTIVFLVGTVAPGLLPDTRADSTKTHPGRPGLFTEWGGIFRIDVYDVGPGARFVLHDGMLGSRLQEYNGDPAELAFFATEPRSLPFAASDAVRDDVLIIGAAGGNEVLASLFFEAGHIDAVELNPITHSLVTDEFADYTGRFAEDPRVNYVVGDGRSFLKRTDRTYDLIWYPAPDSYSATNAASSGAFVLSESYLYTSETIVESLEHLSPDGIVAAQFGELDYEGKPNRTTRYLTTSRDALAELGVDDPSQHLLTITTSTEGAAVLSTVLVKRSPFTEAEVADIVETAGTIPGSVVRYAPGTVLEGEPASIIATATASQLDDWHRSYQYDVTPIADNGPFFWHFTPFTDVIRDIGSPIDAVDPEDSIGERVLLLLLIIAAGLGAIFLLVPFVAIRPIWSSLPRKPISGLYFAALGFGFMFFEISLIQRLVLFLGYPTYSLTVTLASILIFTGIGALVSGRFADSPHTLLRPLVGIIMMLTVFYLFALPWLTDVLLSWPLGARVVVTFLMLAPLGITLGMFMPLGLGAVSRLTQYPREYVAWGWAVNGFASVTGAVLTTILAMAFGFNLVMVLALIVYLVALATLRRLLGPAPQPEPINLTTGT